jgi:hypothetical protein
MYPNQPYWIRGVEVGLVGIVAGLLMDRFGLLPLLIWHYTIDAVYTAVPLLKSHNEYYIVSGAIASLIFLVPLLAAIAMYIRNRGFIPDDDLTNATLPVAPPPAPVEDVKTTIELPPAIPVTRNRVIACVVALAAAGVLFVLRPPSPQDAVDYRITAKEAKGIAADHVNRLSVGPSVRGKTDQRKRIATPTEGFRYWDEQSGREEGGSPGGFDDVAATYLVRSGMSVRDLIRVFRERIEAGTFMVRFFTPGVKEEVFVEVDPRTRRVIGYHKYQDEAARGAQLERDAALAIARGAFATYGLDANAFELREPLSFAQPNRRDWLFHFQEKTPLVASGYRRVTVRVAGSEITQFNKTIKVPESVHREASEQTLLNVILFALQLVGMIALLGLVIAGLVLATREHGLPWRRAARWTLILSVIPIVNFISRYESMLFSYSTAVAWDTFRVSLITAFVRNVGLQAGLVFLALAGVESLMPHAAAVFSRAGRARFGRAAAIAALTALALFIVTMGGLRWIAEAFPAMARVDSIHAPAEVAIPLPAITESLQALYGAIVLAGAVALYAHAVRRHLAIITTLAVFFATLDANATLREAPLMLVSSAVVAAVVWLIARHVLGTNLLAWPLAVFLGGTLNAGSMLLRNSRPDLIVNGTVLVLLAVATLAWTAARSEEVTMSTEKPLT